MKITKLHPAGFGRLPDKEYTFSEGINVIAGPNEAGKTTLRQFLTAMLFGWEKSRAKADPYKRYKPWSGTGAYGGAMELTADGKEYRVERDFTGEGPALTVRQYPSMREVPAPEGLLAAIGSRLTRAGYENTVMVPQGSAAPEGDLAQLYANYIANMSRSKDRGIDVAEALETLSSRRKILEKHKTADSVAELRKTVETLKAREAELDRLAEEQAALRAEKDALARQMEALDSEKSVEEERAFAEWLHGYEAYCEAVVKQESDIAALEERCRQREELLANLPDVDKIEETERRMDALLREREREDAKRETALLEAREREARIARRKRHLAWFWIPAIVLFAAAAVWLFLATRTPGTAAKTGAEETPVWKIWLGIVGATIGAVVAAGALAIRARCGKRLRAAAKAREAAEASSERQRELAAEIAMMPTEEALHAERDRAVGGKARAEALAERIAESEEALAESERVLTAERSKLLSELSAFEPADDLTEGAVEKVRGHILARSVQNKNRHAQLQAEAERLTERIARLSQALEDGDRVTGDRLEAHQRLGEAERTLAAEQTEIAALQLAEDTVRNLSATIHDSFGKDLNKAVSAYADAFTDGAYAKLSADENLTVRTGSGAKATESSLLSTGAAEQVSLALRLAVAEKMYAGEHLPLVFDDSFVYYDNVRLRSALARLAATGEQILIFSCTDREETLLAEEGIPFTKVAL